MKGVAYALTASVALVFGALTSASAGCYGECYQDYRGAPVYERYSERPVYRERYAPVSYEGPRYHTTYYERGEEYPVSYHERPVYRTSSYDDGYHGHGHGHGYGSSYSYDGYYDRPYRPYYRSYGYGYGGYGYGYRYPTVRVGGGWSQTGPAFASHWRAGGWSGGYGGGWGGCKTAYIPYGWTWYRGTSC
jgi:hypothetical protein